MTFLRLWSVVLALFVALSWSATMRLPSFPLAVKTPYLSVWMPGHLSDDFPTATPQFWQGKPLTWIIMARIDEGDTYCLMGCTGGRPGVKLAKQKSLNFTSTHTYVTLQAGSAEVTLDFFSPVDPVDHVRQSLPFSYVTITARKDDGTLPTLGLIMGIDPSWLNNRGAPYVRFNSVKGRHFLVLDGEQGREFSENQQMALWGKVVLASRSDSEWDESSSCQVGNPDAIFRSFVQTGTLEGATGVIEEGGIAACSHTLSYKDKAEGGVFAVGLYQDYEMQYNTGKKIEYYVGYFRSKVANLKEAIGWFLDDYSTALAESLKFDKRIVDIGQVTSANYSDILEFTIRQSFAGQQVMISNDTLDTTHPYAFIKEISTDGNVNTLADLIPKALPVFHVLNPEYTRMFLEPVLRFSKNAWPLNHAVHDIGKSYPNATGETPCIEEFLPLDSTSVLLWMLYLYQSTTGDTELTTDYAPILKTYADYCHKYGLYPVLQRSSVDALGSATNQSALSVSAAIALNAYGKMTGQHRYSKLGVAMAKDIVDIGTDARNTHLLTHYTDEDEAWVLMYPLAFDAWLRLETFPKSVYKMQSDWYSKHTHPFGVQYRNNIRYTLMEWLMWVGATTSDALRDHLVNAVHRFLDQRTGPRESVPGPTQWRVLPGSDEGVWTYFSKAKSVIGSIFMIAAVQGGFDGSYVSSPKYFTPIPEIAEKILVLQEQKFEAQTISPPSVQPALVADSGIPFTVPYWASKSVDSSFLGLSFDTESFFAYSGNPSTPAHMSISLMQNLVRLSGSTLTLRIGGPGSDYASYDPIQLEPLKRIAIDGGSILSIGPLFFDGIKVLGSNVNTNWIYQVPFASYNAINAVQGTNAAMDIVPPKRLYALEIGHKTNLYAGGPRPSKYDCQQYAAEFFEFKVALRNGIERIGTQFQALGLSHGEINDSWTMEECFTVGIKAQEDLQSVSSHYSHFASHKELKLSGLPRHKDIVHEHKKFLPEVNYLNKIFPCHPYVISEASLVSTTSSNDGKDAADLYAQDPLGLTMWNLDFLLYSMSHNVSKVLMHQSCDSISRAWSPKRCFKKVREGEPNAPYFALTFVASFVNAKGDFRVAELEESEDRIVYAGYESGRLSKIAIVNYPPKRDGEAYGLRKRTTQLRLPREVFAVEQVARIGLDNLGLSSEVVASGILGGQDAAQVPMGAGNSETRYAITEGMLSVDLSEGGAVLFEVR